MWILTTFIVFFGTETINGEIFSSKVKLVQLFTYVRTNNKTDILNEYIAQKRSLQNLVKMMSGTPDLMKTKRFNVERPICAFQFVFMCTEGRPEMKSNRKPLTFSFLKAVIAAHTRHLPDEIDLLRVSKGVLLTQEFHQQPTDQAAEGWFLGQKSRALNLKERFHIASHLRGMSFYDRFGTGSLALRALEWLMTAKELARSKEDANELYIPFTQVLLGIKCECSQFAHKVVEDFQKLDPNILLNKTCEEKPPDMCNYFIEKFPKNYPSSHFLALCRGEGVKIADDIAVLTPRRHLRCRYVDNGDGRLIIAPMKVEELNQDYPKILLLHDITNDADFSSLKSVKDLKTINVKTDGNITAYVRSYTQWYNVSMKNLPSQLKIFQTRLSALTKLHQRSFEKLTVSNFGFTGHEQLHLDGHIPSYNDSYPNELVNPIVTTILFLSDVEEGGEEVFPHLGIKVKPVKNTALLYYNVFKNGIINVFSLRGSCPVIRGDKWTAVQRVMNHGQEFTYPCDLDMMK